MAILIKLFIPITLTTFLCVRYFDRPVSRFIKNSFYANRHWSSMTSSLPDILLLLVIFISLAAFVGYLIREKKHQYDAKTRLLGFIALSLPAAYLVKAALKYSFGRVETRIWLQNQPVYTFHWLDGGSGFSGFPSGHMIVLATLFAAISRYLPGYKVLCYSLLAVLALLLVATNYHFVGDVIFGGYIGLLTESVLDRFYSGPPEGQFAELETGKE